MTKTYDCVFSNGGLEGCFPRKMDAEQCLVELREIGIQDLRIEPKLIEEIAP